MTIALGTMLSGILMILCGLLNMTSDMALSKLEVFNVLVASYGWYCVYRSIYRKDDYPPTIGV